MNDDAKLTDEVHIEFPADGSSDEPATPQLDPIPDRPAKSAPVDAWVDYAVALGADRAYLTAETQHFDGDAAEVTTRPALTKNDLIELADRLGG